MTANMNTRSKLSSYVLTLFLMLTTSFAFDTIFYADDVGANYIDIRNQGRVSGITSWGLESGNRIADFRWESDEQDYFNEIGYYEVTSCPPFSLAADDYIYGFRVVWISNTNGITFHSKNSGSYECMFDGNPSYDTGDIYHNGYYLCGFQFRYGAYMDGISFQFCAIDTTSTPTTEMPTTTQPTTAEPSTNTPTTTQPTTMEPSTIPTTMPSRIPTKTPTYNPTGVPTVIPSLIPTSSPSDFPTSTPSLIPTSVPTSTLATRTPTKEAQIIETTSELTTQTDNNVVSIEVNDSDNSTFLMIGVIGLVVGVVMIICIVLIVLYIKRKKTTHPTKFNTDQMETKVNAIVGQDMNIITVGESPTATAGIDIMDEQNTEMVTALIMNNNTTTTGSDDKMENEKQNDGLESLYNSQTTPGTNFPNTSNRNKQLITQIEQNNVDDVDEELYTVNNEMLIGHGLTTMGQDV